MISNPPTRSSGWTRSPQTIVANGFDATDWLYQSWAYQAHDVGTTPGLQRRMYAERSQSIKARVLVLAPPLDLFNPVQSAQEAADEIAGAMMIEIPSVQGHQAATSLKAEDAGFLNEEIGEFLKSLPNEP